MISFRSRKHGGRKLKKSAVALCIVLLLAFCITAMTYASTAAAIPSNLANNIVSANITGFLVGIFNVAYEAKILDILSIRFRINDWAILSLSSPGAGVDLYFYPQAKACRGFFLGPRIDAGAWDNFRVGVQFGHKWVFNDGFEMAVALGGWAGIGAATDSPSGFLGGSLLPTVDYEIGWAF